MSAGGEPILFQTLSTPPASLSDRGLLLVAGLLALGSLATGGLFVVLGAWPVLGFSGAESIAVIGLLLLYRRRARRRQEAVVLVAGRLTIRRCDERGRAEEIRLDPYWTRLRLEPRLGRVSALRLTHRGLAVEIGVLLGEEAKCNLAAALAAALRQYRDPVFDNVQLR